MVNYPTLAYRPVAILIERAFPKNVDVRAFLHLVFHCMQLLHAQGARRDGDRVSRSTLKSGVHHASKWTYTCLCAYMG